MGKRTKKWPRKEEEEGEEEELALLNTEGNGGGIEKKVKCQEFKLRLLSCLQLRSRTKTHFNFPQQASRGDVE